MRIECPRCKGIDTEPVRRILDKAETSRQRCNTCQHAWTVIERDAITVDLSERIQVLMGLLREAESKLIVLAQPSIQLSQAEHLEKQAEEIFDRAQRIRSQLAYDLEHEQEIKAESAAIAREIIACQYCQASKTKVTKGMLRRVVEAFEK